MAKKLKETYIHTYIHTDGLPLVVLSAALQQKRDHIHTSRNMYAKLASITVLY